MDDAPLVGLAESEDICAERTVRYLAWTTTVVKDSVTPISAGGYTSSLKLHTK